MFPTVHRPHGLPAVPSAAMEPLLEPARQPPPSPMTGVAGFPSVSRFTRALTPARKPLGFVPEMNYVGLVPHNRRREEMLTFIAEIKKMTDAYPGVLTMARTLARTFIKERTGKDLDPDKTYFLRFHDAFSGPKAHSGWRHAQAPYESTTLTHLFMRRFTSRDELSGADLNQMSGIYAVREADLYDEKNEVPVLPSELMAQFWKIDFSGTYKKKVDEFWATYSSPFRGQLKAALVVEILASLGPKLFTEDYETLSHLLLGPEIAQTESSALRLISAEVTPPPTVGIFPLSILGHEATDIVVIVVPSGRQILYVPGTDPAFQSLESNQALYEWLKKNLVAPDLRRNLLAHFPARAMDRGLKDVIEKIIHGGFPLINTTDGSGAYAIVKYDMARRITNDLPSALRNRLRERMKDDAEFFLRSNSEVSRQQWIDSLNEFARIGGALAPLAPIIAVPVIGAELIKIGLNVDLAVSGDTLEERHAGSIDAATGAVEVLFNLPLLVTPRTSRVGAASVSGTQKVAERQAGHAAENAASRGAPAPVPKRENPAGTEKIEQHGTRANAFAEPESVHTANPMPEELKRLSLPFRMEEMFGVEDASRVLFNQGDGKHYLELWGGTFMVRYDRSIGCWAIVDPENPHAFFGSRPVRLNAENQWELVSPASLRGGSPLPGRVRKTSILAGIIVSPPRRGEFVQHYTAVIDGQNQPVKYHVPSNSWRTGAGIAYTHDPTQAKMIPMLKPDLRPAVTLASMNKALRAVGLQAGYPFELAVPDSSTAQDIPRRISSLWVGNRLPLAHMQNIEKNALIAGQGKRPFKSTLYLSISDPNERALALRELNIVAPHVQIKNLRKAAFFKQFQASPFYPQYIAASTSRGGNLSSASDLLRYPMINAIGGLYMDIDDSIKVSLPGAKPFGDLDFKALPNGLMLNDPVNHLMLGLRSDFNSSNFGSLPNNPVLEDVSKRMLERYNAYPNFYEARPYQGSNTPELMTDYAHALNYMTGPGAFNSVVAEQMPGYQQFCGLLRIANGELYMEPSEIDRISALVTRLKGAYAPLGDIIDINSTSSWLDNR